MLTAAAFAEILVGATQDVGAPCCSKPQAVCFRSLSELMIEKPPISSTSTLIFVCGGPLEPPRVSSALPEAESDAALARFRDETSLALPWGGGGGGGGGATVFVFFFTFFVFAFFWVTLELLLLLP